MKSVIVRYLCCHDGAIRIISELESILNGARLSYFSTAYARLPECGYSRAASMKKNRYNPTKNIFKPMFSSRTSKGPK